ncbi:MAG: hypothetical protein VX223_16425, partial [Myxococcota bacterium]|nr:hypothetical protein [Myxococcota bacterium]
GTADAVGNTGNDSGSTTSSDGSDGADTGTATDGLSANDGIDLADTGDDTTDNTEATDSTDATTGSDDTNSNDAIDGSESIDATNGTDANETADSIDQGDASDMVDTFDGTDATTGSEGQDTSDGANTTDGSTASDMSDGSDAIDGTNGAEGQDASDGTTGSDGVDGTTSTPNTVTIASIQTAASSLNCTTDSAQQTQANVTLEQLQITTPMVEINDSLSSFWVQEGSDPTQGIRIVMETASAPPIIVGALANITGSVQEFYCETQIVASVVAVVGTAAIIPPTVVDSATLLDNADAENLEGSLIEYKNETISNINWEFGEFTLSSGAVLAGGLFSVDFNVVAGDTVTSAVGVITYEFGKYRMQVRSNDDLVINGTSSNELSITDIQTNPGSVGCIDESPALPPYLTGVKTKGIAVTPQFALDDDLSATILSSSPAGPNSGLFVIFESALGLQFQQGKTYLVEGDVSEYYCDTQLKAFAATETSPLPTVTPAIVTIDEMSSEDYEGTWVELSDLTIVDGDALVFTVTDGVNTLIVETDNFGVAVPVTPGVTLTAAVGVVRYRFGDYRLILTDYN